MTGDYLLIYGQGLVNVIVSQGEVGGGGHGGGGGTDVTWGVLGGWF